VEERLMIRGYWLAVAAALASAACAEAKMTLVKDGKPQATIVVAVDASKNAKIAAEELQLYVQKMSGAKLPIVTDDKAPDGALVMVGRSSLTGAVKIPDGVTGNLREEGFIIQCDGKRLILAGNDTEPYLGTRYAVCDLLNRLGVRWFMPGDFGEVVPETPTIEIPEMDVRESPDFPIRDLWEHGQPGTAPLLEQWKIHNKLNPYAVRWMGLPGDSYVRHYMPDEQAFKDHPEWFALSRHGTRERWMPCMTNPDMLKHFIERVKQEAKEGKGVSAIGCDDGLPRCYCENCKKINSGFPTMACNEPDFDGGPSISQEWFTFINAIQEAVNKEYPQHRIATNGYANRDIPPELPGINKSKNLVIMFANIGACTIHSYDSPHCWMMRRQGQMLKRWCEISDKVWLYNYNRTMLVNKGTLTPIVTRLRRNIPLVKKWGAIGFADEDDSDWALCGIPTRVVRCALEWDVEADVDAVLNDFYSKWFGAAAEPIKAYYNTLEEAFASAPQHGHEDVILPQIYTEGLMAKLDALMSVAEKKAATETEKVHVRLERCILDTMREFVEVEKAKRACNFNEAIKHLDRMAALKDETNKVTPFMGYRAYAVYYLDWEKKRMQDLQAKFTGPDGTLVAVLPEEERFRTDSFDDGIYERWMAPKLDEGQWSIIKTTVPWEDQGYRDEKGHPYNGLAWYRLEVKVPGDAKGKEVHLFAPALVTEAWVWVNGDYVGRRPYMSAWSRPQVLDMDVSPFLKPGEVNQITLRVKCDQDTFGATGIYERMFLYAKTRQEAG
jgi:hypothetical protein